jgi:Autographiviridae endonuclease VII
MPKGPPRKITPRGKGKGHKDWKLKKRYGIGIEEFNSMMENQKWLCLICESKLCGGKFTHVDHNGSTGRVRGILCSKCNQGLGLFKHNIQVLLRAAKYLK